MSSEMPSDRRPVMSSSWGRDPDSGWPSLAAPSREDRTSRWPLVQPTHSTRWLPTSASMVGGWRRWLSMRRNRWRSATRSPPTPMRVTLESTARCSTCPPGYREG